MTLRVGLIGNPVEQSLSPAFQQPAFDALGIDARYELWRCDDNDVAARLADIRSGEAHGANVTVPHKERAAALMDDVSPLARRAGAVNTVVLRDGRLYGDNTDAHGFIVPLRERAFPFASSAAVILGAGGAARGVAVALLDAGVARLTIANRTPERATALCAALDDPRLSAIGPEALIHHLPDASLLVNATSLGWQNAAPLDIASFQTLPTGAIAYDLTYRNTSFLRAARDAGLAAIDGLAMLVHQGARSFEIWTGRPAPVETMWRHAVAARDARGA